LEHAVEPAGHRDALGLHQLLRAEAPLHVLVVDLPDARPMLPGAGRQAEVTRQRVRQRPQVRRALHVVVAAEDVRAAAGYAQVAERQLQHAIGPRVVVGAVVLRGTHAPGQRAGPVVGHRAGDAAQLRAGHAGDALGLLRVPLADLVADLVHAPDALADELLVLPAVLEDVPEDAPNQRHVGAGAEAHV